MTRPVGLVVAGAGARGAYEAGVLSAMVPRMVESAAMPSILVGTSAGALNLAALACFIDRGVPAALAEVNALWQSTRLHEVVGVGSSIAGGLGYIGHIVGLPGRLTSLLDTERQRGVLQNLLPWGKLHDNIANGPIDAVAVATTSVSTGATVIFVEKKPSVKLPPADLKRNISYVETTLTADHVLASAAVPVIFRPVEVSDPTIWKGWYVDGGLRLNTPLKPAIDFGCNRVGIVASQSVSWLPSPPDPTPEVGPRPDVFAVASVVLRATLADRMVEDVHTLSKVNQRIARHGSASHRRIEFLFAGPPRDRSGDLAALANETFRREFGGIRGVRNPALWSLNRLIGGIAADHGELLSFMFFDAAFTTAAVRLGVEHAEAELVSGVSSRVWLSALGSAGHGDPD